MARSCHKMDLSAKKSLIHQFQKMNLLSRWKPICLPVKLPLFPICVQLEGWIISSYYPSEYLASDF